jgi:hypothetical protein
MRKYQTDSRSQRGRVFQNKEEMSMSFEKPNKTPKTLGNQMVVGFKTDTP